MENPSNWGKVRRTIDRAIEKNKLEGEDGRLGRSLVSTIYDELHASGYIAEDEPDEPHPPLPQTRRVLLMAHS